MKERRKTFLPRVYIKFPDHELRRLSSFNSKIKASMRKLLKLCGHFSVVALRLADIIHDNKWRSAWLVLFPEEHIWYSVDRIYWKRPNSKTTDLVINDEDKENMPPGEDNEEGHYWLKNKLYNLKNEDKGILLSSSTWLNDRILDAAQKLICNILEQLTAINQSFPPSKWSSYSNFA